MNATQLKVVRPPVTSSRIIADWPPADSAGNLLKVALEAIQITPPDYFRSVFGTPRNWLPPHRRYSEFNIIDPWSPVTTARFLMDISIPSSAVTPPNWARALLPPLVNRRLWRPTGFFRQPDEYGSVSSFPGEHWFFINGIATNTDLAQFNAAYIAHLFHRPVTVIQNATNSVPVDVFECVLGKGFSQVRNNVNRKYLTEPAWRATTAILEAINAADIRRVVVLAHSQGTIIMANVLRTIVKALHSKLVSQKKPRWHPFTEKLMGGVQNQTRIILRNSLAHSLSEFAKGGRRGALEKLAKLEIYTFANCANFMRYVSPSRQIPYMEHFANERDVVARLGILSPLRDGPEALIDIEGPVFEQKEAWGHLLNEHYLSPIDDFLYPGDQPYFRERDPYIHERKSPPKPRLYEYFHGKQPSVDPQAP